MGKACDRMKPSVLHVIAGLDSDMGGPSRSVPNQCLWTARAGLRVGIISVSRGKALSPEALRLKLQGVEAIYSGPFRAAWALWGAVARYDIIHVNGIWRAFCHLGALFARIQKKPLVITPHGMLEPWSLQAKKLKKWAGYKLYQESDLQHAVVLQATAIDEAKHLKGLGLRPDIAVIANGVEIPRFKGLRPRPGDRRRRLLFLSRLHPKKGLIPLLRALASMRPAFEKGRWILTLAGPDEGGHLAELKREAGRLGIENLVEFYGPLEGAEKWALYRSAELFVLPTYSENFGLVVAEALGCGVPVITTQGAPWSELVTKRCGWWHPVGQKDLEMALAQALATPPAVLKSMGQRGRRLVLQNYAWPKIGKKLGRTYEWILGRGSRPGFIQ